MRKPSEKTIKRLFALSGNYCAFPGCHKNIVAPETGLVYGEICHIHARREGGARYVPMSDAELHDYENLVLLCSEHHTLIDSDVLTYNADTIARMKAVHEEAFGRDDARIDSLVAKSILQSYVGKMEIRNATGPISITANIVKFGKINTSIKQQPAPGTIGADQQKARYVEYLINKYNKFAGSDPFSTRKFHPGIISRKIRERFKVAWRSLSTDKMGDLSKYLYVRIDSTSIGRIKKAKGELRYRSFQEFIEKYG